MLRTVVLFASALLSLHDFFRSKLEHYGVAGGSVLVITDGHVSAREYVGDANRELHQRVDAETTFHWASITKTFTGIAILQLRDRGLLKLNDPVVKYVPELRAVHDPYGPIDAITIRELMTHSAGFRAATWLWSGDHDWEPFEPTEWSQIVAMLPYTEILFPPGSKHSYSNLGVVFLGQIIERLSGDPYQVYIDKNILKPLQMYASYFDRAPYFLLKHRAEGYYREKGVLIPAPFNFSSGITVSNSGLNAPLSDMAKYLEFLLGRSESPNADLVLKRSSLEEMFRKQLPIQSSDASQTAGSSGRDWIGLSFFLHEQGGRTYIGHGGEQGGFISHFYLDPAHGNAYIAAFNTDSSDQATNTHSLDRELRDYIFEHVFETR
jgi:CubicO group peptidase (beta-lactamase class C family)